MISLSSISLVGPIKAFLAIFLFLPISVIFLLMVLVTLLMLIILSFYVASSGAWDVLLYPLVVVVGLAWLTFMLHLLRRWLLSRRTIMPLTRLLATGRTKRHVGHKAWRLGAALAAGDNVLPGLVINGEEFAAYLRRHGTASELVDYDSILHLPPPMEIASQLVRRFRRKDVKRVIVRSSFMVEDSTTLSWAGCFTSIADVDATDDRHLAEAIRQVWASYYGSAAVTYRQRHGLALEKSPATAVLIQPQLTPKLLGLAASFDIAGDREDLISVEIEQPFAGCVLYSRLDGGMQADDLDEETAVTLAPTVLAVADIVLRHETREGRPVQIEWALGDDDRVVLLQVRPLLFTPSAEVYTNSSIIDLIPYPLTPLSEDVLIADDFMHHMVVAPVKGLIGKLPSVTLHRFAGRWYLPVRELLPLLNKYRLFIRASMFFPGWFVRTRRRARRYCAGKVRRPHIESAPDAAGEPVEFRWWIRHRLRPIIIWQARWTYAANAMLHFTEQLTASLPGDDKRPRWSSALSPLNEQGTPYLHHEAELREYTGAGWAAPSLPAIKRAETPAFPENRAYFLPIRRLLMRFLLNSWTYFDRARTQAKYEILEIYDRLRNMTDRIAAQRGLAEDDAFFFTLAELSGEAVPTKEEIERRRRQYLADCKLNPGPIVLKCGELFEIPPTTEKRLAGKCLCPGEVAGTLCVIAADAPPPLADIKPGCILVIPDGRAFWVPYLGRASGVVMTGGTPLSHLAIVGREFGIPLVLFGAGLDLVDGAKVFLDATRGVIRIVD